MTQPPPDLGPLRERTAEEMHYRAVLFLLTNVVRTPTGCWLWLGSCRSRPGYARMVVAGKVQSGHRFAYEALRGPIPDGLQIDHLCRVPRCVNPDHLEAVDNRTNTLRGIGPTAQLARATTCLNGHPFNALRIRYNRPARVCGICQRVYDNNYKQRVRERRHQHAL